MNGYRDLSITYSWFRSAVKLVCNRNRELFTLCKIEVVYLKHTKPGMLLIKGTVSVISNKPT